MQDSIEKVVIVGVRTQKTSKCNFDESMNELERLAETAGGRVIDRVEQTLNNPNSATFVGSGKLEFVKKVLEENEAFTVIFDDDLKPNQARNIGKVLGKDIKVIDRSGLILDIFATRARTNAAKIQVELAQLEYLLPRLAGMWGHLSRQYGGSIGARGPGETQLEIDRRVVRRRIATLKLKLEKIEKQRRTQRKGRSNSLRVAILGYTNAGKSTLLNKMTHANAYAEDKLFATLDPRTKILRTPECKTALLTDTVGFIRKLPHHLVESFRSTLAEAKEADILIIVADALHEALDDHLIVVEKELERMQLVDTPKILTINKIDLIDELRYSQLSCKYPEAVFISAQDGKGLNKLIEKIFTQDLHRVVR
ncbi:GTPase HflX [bacterium]|nr:GTPase HflX [bacterium]